MLKLITILFFIAITAFPSYCQTYIQDGDRCFDGGDYVCAVTNYNNAFINAMGKDKQIAEIKLTRAKWCAEHIKTANQSFSAKNYLTAKDEYQKVLDSNPKDSYAQSQIVKCDNVLNPPKLRKATTAELTDIWNNKFGIQPQRRENLINEGIDADDAQKRINSGEGKPQEKEKQASGRTSPNSKQSSSPKEQTTQSNAKKCFNCPKTQNTWGLTLGYAQQTIDYYSMDVIQFGLKAEPLFRYGFGLNTGINLLGYSKNFFESDFETYAVNIPLHFEYRLNFSKWFNAFAYGGVGFNALSNLYFDNYSFPATFEYGGGFRISHVQFNIGRSLYLGNLRNTQNFGKHTEMYQKLNLSVSYMFRSHDPYLKKYKGF